MTGSAESETVAGRASRSSPSSISLWGLILLGLLGHPAPVFAQAKLDPGSHRAHPEEAARAEYVSFIGALRRASESSPEVRFFEAGRSVRSEAVSVAHSGFRQVPQLGAQLGPRISGGSLSPDVTVSLSQSLPLKNLGHAQRQLAEAEQALLEAEVAAERRQASVAAGSAWLDLALSEELLKLRSGVTQEAAATMALTSTRVESGEADPGQLALAESELASAKAAVLEAEELHFHASSRLAFSLGVTPGIRVEVRGNLTELAGPDDPLASETRSSPIEQHPEVLAARQKSTASDHATHLTSAGLVPTFAVGVQYQREGTGDQIVTGTLSLPVPLFRPWRYGELRQKAVAERDRAEVPLIARRLEGALERALHEERHARVRLELLMESALPASKKALEVASAQYESGETDLLRLSLARRAHLATQERLAMAQADLARARLALWSLTTPSGTENDT